MKSKTMRIKIERPDQGVDILKVFDSRLRTVGLIEIEIECATATQYDKALRLLDEAEQNGDVDFPFGCEEVQS